VIHRIYILEKLDIKKIDIGRDRGNRDECEDERAFIHCLKLCITIILSVMALFIKKNAEKPHLFFYG